MLEAVKRRVKRALADTQQLVGNLLNALGDRPAVHRLEGDGFHDQKIECALQDIGLVAHATPLVDWHRESTESAVRKFPPVTELRDPRHEGDPSGSCALLLCAG